MTESKPESDLALWQARAILAALCFVAFLPFLWSNLFWDDFLVIRPDGPVAHLSTLRRVFAGRCVLFDQQYVYPYYRPLIDGLFVLEYAVAGTHPLLYHLTNFLLHLGNVLLAFEIFRRILPVAGSSAPAAAAFLGAGFFAFHPLQVESVLWAAARPAVLSLFLAQLGFLALVVLYRRGDLGLAARCGMVLGAVVGFAASLLAKEIGVALLPALLLLLAARPHRAPMRVVAAVAGMATVLVVYMSANSAVGDSAHNLGSGSAGGFVAHLARAYGFYLSKLILPVSLIPRYPPGVENGGMYLWIGVAGAVVSLAGIVVCLCTRRPVWVIAGAGIALWGGSSLLPLLGGQQTLADRYLYQALWGLGLAVAACLYVLSGRVEVRRLFLAGGAALFVLCALSLRQSAYWQSAPTMWTRVLEVDPRNFEANLFLGEYFEQRGDTDAALSHYQAAADTGRDADSGKEPEAVLAVGRVYFSTGNYEPAIKAYRQAALFPPLAADARIREAVVLSIQGKKGEAHELIAKTEVGDNERPTTYMNLALLALRMDGDRQTALRWYAKARIHGAGPVAELEALGPR